MLVTILDNSVPFDGRSADAVPLGGPEKGVIALAVSLAKRGHTVRVFNRCEQPSVVDSVSWRPITECDAAHSDWLIVHRDPQLFKYVPNATRTALWISGEGSYLDNSTVLSLVKYHRPLLLLQSLVQSLSVPASLTARPAEVIAPAVLECYRTAPEMLEQEIPKAVITTHPAHDLGWLLDIWITHVKPRVPSAELSIYSSILGRGVTGGEVPEYLQPLLAKVKAAEEKGIRVFRPLPDEQMSQVYRGARVHLYPSNERDVLCTTLGDSQAVGLPAVARDKGAARERLLNGQTGFLAPDDTAFANLTVQLLDDVVTFNQFSTTARERQRGRGWGQVAMDLERVLL